MKRIGEVQLMGMVDRANKSTGLALRIGASDPLSIFCGEEVIGVGTPTQLAALLQAFLVGFRAGVLRGAPDKVDESPQQGQDNTNESR
mgnify:CR=1 FL=1